MNFDRFWWLMKLQRIMVTLCWRGFLLAYFCVGVGAWTLVFLIEVLFFLQITHHLGLSYVIAGILESAKVGTSLIKQALGIAKKVTRVRISPMLQGLTALFQIALIILSLICSVMVVTAFLDGTYEYVPETMFQEGESPLSLSSQMIGAPHVMVTSALAMLREGFGVELKPSIFISAFALLISGLFQGMMYIVFGHLLATQANEIEQIFTAKHQKNEAKKNSTRNT